MLPLQQKSPRQLVALVHTVRRHAPRTQTIRPDTMANNSSQPRSGGNRNSNRSRGNRSRGGSRNRNRSNRGGGNRGDAASRHPGGGGSQRRFVKQKVPRRTKPPTFWEKLLGLIGLGGPRRKSPAQKQPTPAQPPHKGTTAAAERPKRKTSSQRRGEGTERQARKPEKVEVTGTRLYVGNLSYDTGDADLEKLFAEVGEVANAEVVCHQRNQRSKGYAFVEMADIGDAKRAVDSLHDREFMGRKIVVSGAKSAGPKAKERA